VALAAFGKDAECVSISPEIGCRVVRSKLDVIGDVCVVQTHAEIIKVPKESIVFENEVGCQGFCWGSAMGVQFHPEYNLEDGRVRAALRKDAGEVTLEYFNDALDSLQDGRRNDGPLVWDRLIVPWLQGKLQIK
jgi:GMP synthase-like glutamine amidotransferase